MEFLSDTNKLGVHFTSDMGHKARILFDMNLKQLGQAEIATYFKLDRFGIFSTELSFNSIRTAEEFLIQDFKLGWLSPKNHFGIYLYSKDPKRSKPFHLQQLSLFLNSNTISKD